MPDYVCVTPFHCPEVAKKIRLKKVTKRFKNVKLLKNLILNIQALQSIYGNFGWVHPCCTDYVYS